MVDTMHRLLLSPILIAQVLWVLARASRLDEAAGPRSGVTGTGPDLHLRIIGDSSAAGVGAATQSQALIGHTVQQLAPTYRVHWTLDARSGATSRSTLAQLAQQKPAAADVVILILGVNDTTRLTPVARWRAGQSALMKRIRTLYDPDLIYVTAVPPLDIFPLLPRPLRSVLHRHGQMLEGARRDDLAHQPDARLVPFDLTPDPAFIASDGFHPSPKLYAVWGKLMADRIRQEWRPQA